MPAINDELGPPSFSASARNLQRQLETSPYWSLRGLTCVITKKRIVLRGTVPCFYLKQVAQTLALRTIGAGRIESDIEVQSE
jgi:hypothetical protein